MALDAEYFDSIYIEVVKKKYYDAEKVQAVFAEIREQAEQLHAENDELRRQLAEVRGRKVELGDALLSAQGVYQEVVERAQQKANGIIAAAETRAAAIQAEARRQSDQLLARSRDYEENAAHRVEAALNRMKQIHQTSMNMLDTQWQQFLCSLDPEEVNEDATNAIFRKEQPKEESDETVLPPDLEAKVGAIAEGIFSLEENR